MKTHKASPRICLVIPSLLQHRSRDVVLKDSGPLLQTRIWESRVLKARRGHVVTDKPLEKQTGINRRTRSEVAPHSVHRMLHSKGLKPGRAGTKTTSTTLTSTWTWSFRRISFSLALPSPRRTTIYPHCGLNNNVEQSSMEELKHSR